MFRKFLTILFAVAFAATAVAKDDCTFGTNINFEDTPKEAAALAKKQEKLCFILHVSGHFEDPRFT